MQKLMALTRLKRRFPFLGVLAAVLGLFLSATSAQAVCMLPADLHTACMNRFGTGLNDPPITAMRNAGCTNCYNIQNLCDGTQTCANACNDVWHSSYSTASNACKNEIRFFCSCPTPPACVGGILPTNSLCEDCGTANCYTPNQIIPAPAGCCGGNDKCIADSQGKAGYCTFVSGTPACTGGRVYDTNSNSCVCPIIRPYWNGALSRCEACGGGRTWNATTGACECPAGQTWNAGTGTCECSGGRVWNATTKACECTGGRTWNGTACACPTGQTWNATTSTCECPAGQTWNATTSTCEAPAAGGGGGGTNYKSKIIPGDCRGDYGEQSDCQQPGWIAQHVSYSVGGTVVPTNTDCPSGNNFIGDPNQCTGKPNGTVLPGSVQFSQNVGFCGAYVCQGGAANLDLAGAGGQRTNCAANPPAFTLDFSDPTVTNQKCVKNCQLPQQLQANGNCECPTGQVWDGTACVAPPDLSQHTCGLNSPGIINQGFTAINQVVNPKLACCTRGWGTDLPGAAQEAFRLDCVERTTLTGITEFDQFYNENRATPDAILDAGLNFPNRLFLVDPASGIPISGFYNSKGERCSYTNGRLPVTTQLNLFDLAITTGQVPAQVGNPDCTRLVRQALEVRCPPNPANGNRAVTYPFNAQQVRRCTAAGRLIVHTDVRDFTTRASTAKGISAFRTMTTFTGGGDTLPGDRVRGYVLPKEIQYQSVIESVYRATSAVNCRQINPALKNDARTGFCIINE